MFWLFGIFIQNSAFIYSFIINNEQVSIHNLSGNSIMKICTKNLEHSKYNNFENNGVILFIQN